MKNQRGIATGWLIGALVLVCLLAGAYLTGRHDGAKITEEVWQEREAQINKDTADKILTAEERIRTEERAKAQQLVDISTTLQTKLKDKDNALELALNAVRDGRIRLSIPANATGGNPESSPTASASGGNAAARTYLPQTVADALLRIGSEADAVVLQLLACQDVVRADRK